MDAEQQQIAANSDTVEQSGIGCGAPLAQGDRDAARAVIDDKDSKSASRDGAEPSMSPPSYKALHSKLSNHGAQRPDADGEAVGSAKPRPMAKAAVVAAMAAVAGAAPAQRDRLIAQIASSYAAAAQQQQERNGTAQGPGSGGGSGPPALAYEPPTWAGIPEGVSFSLEILKDGSIIEARELSGKGHFNFGRSPNADFVLEHPTSSRLHAVLQFKAARGPDASSNAAPASLGADPDAAGVFIWDAGSTHGTFVNKQRIKPKVYVPLAVGHTIRLGQSSRLYILAGPAELMPEEGLSRTQRRQLAALEYSRKAAAKDEAVGASQMAAAIHGGATWGMGDEYEDPLAPDADVDSIDWRAYAARNPLNANQQKLAEKIRAREYKADNLRKENERIMAKERIEGGLTQGQASTLARNETGITKCEEEMEELEEQMRESVHRALQDKVKGGTDAAKAIERKKRRTPTSDDEYLGESSSEDEFFDRTAGPKRGPGKAASKRVKGGEGRAVMVVETAESLYGKRELFREDIIRLKAAVAAEEARTAPAAAGTIPDTASNASATANAAPATAATSAREGSDIVMADTAIDTVAGHADSAPAAAAAAAGYASSAHDGLAESAAASISGQGGSSGGEAVNEDSLDAFMQGMGVQVERDKLVSLRKELAEAESALKRVEKLLRLADPNGWLQPKGAGAAAAAAAEARVKELERAAALAAREQEKAAAAAAALRKQRELADVMASLEPEQEQEEEEDAGMDTHDSALATIQSATAGAKLGASTSSSLKNIPARKPIILMARGPAAASAAAGGLAATAAATAGQLAGSAAEPSAAARVAAAAAAAEIVRSLADPVQVARAQGRSHTAGRAKATAGMLAPEVQATADAAVDADLALLRAAGQRRQAEEQALRELEGLPDPRVTPETHQPMGQPKRDGASADGGAEAMVDVWAPPTDQKGDGRTALNDKYGY